jgi:hypothetical protein
MLALPQHFTVSATVNSAAADAILTVAPGVVFLGLAPDSRRALGVGHVTHDDGVITMLKARLHLPFANTRVVLEEPHLVAVATLAGWSRARFRSSVARAGFELREVTGWMSPPLDAAEDTDDTTR